MKKHEFALNTYYTLTRADNPFSSYKAMLNYYKKKNEGVFLHDLEHELRLFSNLEIEWAMQKLASKAPKNSVPATESFSKSFIPMFMGDFKFEQVENGRTVAGNFSLLDSLIKFDFKEGAPALIGMTILVYFLFIRRK